MTARIQRARLLADDLRDALAQLASEPSSRAAIVFLDRLARLERFDGGDLRAAGADGLIADAREARTQNAAAFASWAGAGLGLDQLVDAGRRIADGAGETQSDRWAQDALLVAEVAPYLPAERRRRAEEVLEEVACLAESAPEPFLGAAQVAADRRECERPGETTARLLEAFESLPELVELDRKPTAAATLEDVYRVLSRRVPDRAEIERRIRRADEALSRATARKAQVIELFRRDAPLRMAAAVPDPLPAHALLRRLGEGELLLVRRGGRPVLEWWGPGAPTVSLVERGSTRELLPEPGTSPLRWLLPDAAGLGAAPGVLLQLGPDRVEIGWEIGGAAQGPDVRPARSEERVRFDQLETWLSCAPGAVEAEARRIAASAPNRLVARAFEDLAMRAGRARAGERNGRGCAFPVVACNTSSWLPGAVFQALVLPEARPPVGTLPLTDAFPGEAGTVDLLRRLFDRLGARQWALAPAMSLDLLELEGRSCMAAFALAAEAEARGVSVPADLVVSAAIELDPSGRPVLAPVSGCNAKARILERERPGCRFLYVPMPGEEVEPSTEIRLEPLPPLSVEAFFDRVLEPSTAPGFFEDLFHRAARADECYARQDYPAAEAGYRELLAMLESAPDSHPDVAERSFTALVRMGGIQLHGGRPDDAQRWFERARELARRHSTIRRTALVEMRVAVSESLVDNFRPDDAEAAIASEIGPWERALQEGFVDGPEHRMALVSLLATLHRVYLLRGDVEKAIEVEERAVAWAPAPERARTLGDLAVCYRRAGRFEEAERTLEQAFLQLDAMLLEKYRENTRRFLEYHRGRLALAAGWPVPPASELVALAESLHPEAAARWRLELLAGLVRLREGDEGGLAAIVGLLDRQERPFVRWHLGLGLLEAAELAPALGGRAREAAVRAFAASVPNLVHHPALAEAHRRFVEAVQAGRVDAEAESALRRLSAY